MSQNPTPGGPNQTLLELILALKGLAQTFDIAHANLRSFLEAESKANSKEIDRLQNLVAKNNQSMSVLPITISDRVEKLIDRLEGDIDDKVEAMLREILIAITQVQDKFVNYIQSKGEAVPEELLEGPKSITGRVEVHRDGTVGIEFRAEWAKKMIQGLKWASVGAALTGGGYGFLEFLRWLLW